MTSISVTEYKKLFKKTKSKGRTKRPKAVKQERVVSEGEAVLSQQLRAYKINFEQEFKFCETRRWAADFYLTGQMILIEVEGGIWSGGRHTRGKGYLGDMEKYNTATALGYQVYRYSTEQVKSGYAIGQIKSILEGKK